MDTMVSAKDIHDFIIATRGNNFCVQIMEEESEDKKYNEASPHIHIINKGPPKLEFSYFIYI